MWAGIFLFRCRRWRGGRRDVDMSKRCIWGEGETAGVAFCFTGRFRSLFGRGGLALVGFRGGGGEAEKSCSGARKHGERSRE